MQSFCDINAVIAPTKEQHVERLTREALAKIVGVPVDTSLNKMAQKLLFSSNK